MHSLLLVLAVATAAPEWRQPSAGRPWTYVLEAKGGVPPYQWTLESAAPPGIYLVDLATVMLGSASRPALFGAPADAGRWPVSVRVVDAEGTAATFAFELEVSPLSLKQTSVNASTEEALEWPAELLAGVPPLVARPAESAYLPLGLTFSEDGVLRGQAAAPGAYEIPVEVRDAGGNLLRTTLNVAVYGKETTLPPVALRLRLVEGAVVIESPVAPELVSLEARRIDEQTVEVVATQRETGEQARALYALPVTSAGAPAGALPARRSSRD